MQLAAPNFFNYCLWNEDIGVDVSLEAVYVSQYVMITTTNLQG